MQDFPTATVIGCNDAELRNESARHLGSPRFRVYTSQEVTSIELGGALKNVFAVAAGISDGLRLGDNSKAALVTRSLAELVRLGLPWEERASFLWIKRRGRFDCDLL